MKTKTKIKSVKKTTKSNVVDIPKQIKELKITLERGTDGKWIKDLNYYYILLYVYLSFQNKKMDLNISNLININNKNFCLIYFFLIF